RPLEKIVPLRPVLGDFSVRVDDDQRVFPARVDALLAAPFFVGIFRQITRSASAGQAGHWSLRRIAERYFAGWEGETRPKGGNRCVHWAFQDGQFAALRDEHSIRAFREDAFDGSPRPILVSGKRSKRLRPVCDGLVGA